MEEKRETIVAGQATGKRTESGNNVHNADGTFGSGEGTQESAFEPILNIGGIDDINWDEIEDDEFSYLNDLLKPGGNFNRIEGEHNIEDDCKINPNVSKGSSYYTKNCTHCVTAYALRRKGYDVEATGLNGLGFLEDNFRYGDWRRAFLEPDGTYMKKHTFKAQRKETLYREIIEYLTPIQNGCFIFRCQWDSHNGHVFNIEVRDNQLYFIEPQRNYYRYGSNAEEHLKYYIEQSRPTSWEMYRVDTCEPNWDLIEKETVVKNKKS